MITKAEMIEIIKAENPTLRIGNDQDGYTQLTDNEYEAQIEEWADARLTKEQSKLEKEAARLVKISAYEKLGLSETEIEALLPTPQPLNRA